MAKTPTNEEMNSMYEEQNQALMEKYGLAEIEVVRNSKGEFVQMAGMYPDGEVDVLYHMGGRPAGPAHASTSRKPGAAAKEEEA